VGIEIDYENSSSPNITGLQAFINAYRSQLPYDATGANPAARLTIDLAAGDRYLIGVVPDGDRQLAHHVGTGFGLCQCDGAEQASRYLGGRIELAGAYRWQAAVQSSDWAASSGQVYRQSVHRDG